MVQRSKTVLMALRHRWPERRQKEKGSEGRGGEDRVETAPTGGRLTTINQRQTNGWQATHWDINQKGTTSGWLVVSNVEPSQVRVGTTGKTHAGSC